MSNIKRVVGINLGILISCTLLFFFAIGSGHDKALGMLIGSAMLIAVQVGINLLISIVFFFRKQPELGKAFLLSAAVVLVVGFSTCYGSAVLS